MEDFFDIIEKLFLFVLLCAFPMVLGWGKRLKIFGLFVFYG